MQITENKQLADYLKARRRELRITQEELADLTGLSISGIKKIEKNEASITIKTLLRLKPHLGIKLWIEEET